MLIIPQAGIILAKNSVYLYEYTDFKGLKTHLKGEYAEI
jgi:hypothetical protein